MPNNRSNDHDDDQTPDQSRSRSQNARSESDSDLHDQMEPGGSSTSAYGDEQSTDGDRYRKSSAVPGVDEANDRTNASNESNSALSPGADRDKLDSVKSSSSK